MVNPVNLLVLDEPTNHLDLPELRRAGGRALAYPGTVLLVTHDRYLIREVAEALVAVRGGSARRFDGVDEAVLSPHFDPTKVAPPIRPSTPAKTGGGGGRGSGNRRGVGGRPSGWLSTERWRRPEPSPAVTALGPAGTVSRPSGPRPSSASDATGPRRTCAPRWSGWSGSW